METGQHGGRLFWQLFDGEQLDPQEFAQKNDAYTECAKRNSLWHLWPRPWTVITVEDLPEGYEASG